MMAQFSRWICSWGVFVLLVVVLSGSTAAQDLRDQYGTRNLDAARALDEGIRMVQTRKLREGLTKLDGAITYDPALHLAYYWKALALHDLGEIDESIAVYEKLLDVGRRTKISSVVIEGCVNCALTLAKIEEERKASIWFTRAIMLDPTNSNHLHWKAYRNMAIAQHKKGRNLSAAMCAILGHLATPERVSRKMIDDFLRRGEEEEVGQVLYFESDTPELKPRVQDDSLTEVKGFAAKVAGKLSRLMLDASGGRVLAFSSEKPEFFVIDYRNGNRVTKVTAPAKIWGASISEGRLFGTLAEPSRLVELEITTGKVVKTWPLPGGVPYSVAVLPRAGLAVYPLSRMLHTFDLETGKQAKTDFFSTGVAGDPTGKFVYSFVRPEYRSSTGHILIRGRPIFFHSRRTDWSQTTLYRFAVAKKKLLPASFRTNAASNGRSLHVSPDANWLALVGGGGWRPKNSAKGAGYGVAVLDSNDLSKVQGFFAVGAYPLATAVNPVTHQVVVVRKDDARVYHLTDSKKHTMLKGPFTAGATWSGDGQYLYVLSPSGLKAFRQQLAPAEVAYAKQWPKQLAARLETQPERDEPVYRIEAIPELATFKVLSKTAEVEKTLKDALENNRATKPLKWTSHAPYMGDPKLASYLREAARDIKPMTAGLHIYRLKKKAKEHQDHAAIAFLLGKAYYETNQFEEAMKQQVGVVRKDQGRTTISIEALECLGRICKKFDHPMRAAHCYAAILAIDGYNKALLDDAEAAFKTAGLADSAAELISRGRKGALVSTTSGRTGAVADLPDLPIEKRGSRLTSEKLFRRVAPSVVMIRTASGTGARLILPPPPCIAKIVIEKERTKDAYSRRFVRVSTGMPRRLRNIRASP